MRKAAIRTIAMIVNAHTQRGVLGGDSLPEVTELCRHLIGLGLLSGDHTPTQASDIRVADGSSLTIDAAINPAM
jgi:hypothetical protein